METNFKKVFLLSLFDNKLKRGTRLVQDNRIPGQIPLITAGKENYGISDYISFNKELFFANSITIDMFGNAFYRSYNFFADDNILVLYNKNFSKNILLYLTSAINAATKQQFSYGKQFHMGEAKKLQITVPVTSTGELNLEYMTQYVQRIESKYVQRIESKYVQRIDDYLAVLGYKTIDDCKLNDKDLAVLKGADRYKEFVISDLFVKKTARGFSQSSVNMQKSKNGYHILGQNISYQYPYKVILPDQYLHTVNKEHPIIGYASSTGSINIIQESFYRTGNNGAFQTLKPIKVLSVKPILYLLTVLRKVFMKFNYNTSVNDIAELKVSLPVTSTGEPDYDFMEAYITAIMKKQVLKVKQMLDHKLSLYQNAIK